MIAALLAAAISIRGAWSQPALSTAVVYATIRNDTDREDSLRSASSPRATHVSFHRSLQSKASGSMDGMPMAGMVEMKGVRSIDIPAHGSVSLAPGGLHIMLEGLRHPLSGGDTFVLDLEFAHAGHVRALVRVRSFADDRP